MRVGIWDSLSSLATGFVSCSDDHFGVVDNRSGALVSLRDATGGAKGTPHGGLYK